MTFRFLLDDVSISVVDVLDPVISPLYQDDFVKLNENYFTIHIPHVANIGAKDGAIIEIEILGEVDQKSIELYLNGSILGAILHQRKVLPFHGSSIAFKGKGILFCGESGAGKSTITYGFSRLPEYTFLTDDITPIEFPKNIPTIKAISERMKLWYDTLVKFKTDPTGFELVRDNVDKYFVPIKSDLNNVELSVIFFIQKTDGSEIVIEELKGAQTIQNLLHNVYRRDFLKGMKATEMSYFNKHALIASSVKSYSINRPLNSNIEAVMDKIRTIIHE